ncbi:hypothetical protein [Hahella ganghwensis]|uniref:hypothetical protein n=1 Tax=Hahella ganghwensis TaxID=286420 RepID=UPI00036CFA1D|nr:hypothetical protein [Hahella ganghwensis]
MKLYMLVDTMDWGEVDESMTAAITEWAGTQGDEIELVNVSEEATGERHLGINIQASKASQLKEPLNFLYGLAKTHKLEFVVGIYDPDSRAMEDICYFGHEEGRPDAFEVANYLFM